ncbi:MAG TPA: GspMb/PilO family protein [Luteitalea sp.]|nr:GspMb/PilO family protein [Luteitalea sp.]
MVPTARLIADRRLLFSVLTLLTVLNVVGLIAVFGPLRVRVQTLAARAAAASSVAQRAARELNTARQTSAGSVKAVGDLQRFYSEILPVNQPASRQMTFVRLAQLARDVNLSYDARRFGQDPPEKGQVLTRATLEMSVYGDYRALRQFIYRLETGEDFVVIRDLTVARGSETNDPLEAALLLSTYFKAPDGP